MLSYDVEAPQITEQMRKLDNFAAVAKSEYVPAMNAAIALSVLDIRAKAPTLSGNLASSVGGSVKYAAGDEVRGVMTADARGANGFPYGYALNVSSKYRYAGGRKKTKGWMRNVIFRKKAEVMALFISATSRIVSKLAVGGDGG